MNSIKVHPAPPPGPRIALRLLLVVTALLPGCAQYRAAPMDPRRGAEQFEARRLEEPKLGEDVGRLMGEQVHAWPPQQFNRAQLLAVALVLNPQLELMRVQVRASEAHQITAGEPVNPDLTLQSEYARHDAHPWLYGLSMTWLLRPTQRRRIDQEISRLDTSAANFELMEKSWALRRDLAAAMSAWESSRRRLALLESLAQSHDRLLALETQRVEAGEDSPGELLFARQSRLEIEQQRGEVRAASDAAQAAAAQVLGVLPQALDGVNIVWPDWGEPPAVDEVRRRALREQALLSRADLEIAIRGYAIAESKLKLAVARQYPQLTLGPGYYWDHGVAKFPLDIGFTLPLNRNRGEIAEAHAARDIAGQRLLAIQADIDGAIAAAERTESRARTRTDAAEQRYASAVRQAELAQLGVHLGASGSQERVSSEIIAARAQLEVIQMRSELQAARNALEDVLHMPLSGPELGLARAWSSTSAAGGS